MQINTDFIKSYVLEELLPLRMQDDFWCVVIITLSYMIKPVLVMDGTLLPLMYVLFPVPSGHFATAIKHELPNVKAYEN